MFKKILVIAAAGFILTGCTDKKAQEKALLEDVIKTHDKVMMDDGIVMKNKMLLKDIAAKDAAAAVKDSVARYTKLLGDADDSMMTWMNKFNPDFSGKSHDETMNYLNTQKEQIGKISLQLDSAISASNNYIKKAK
jgi:succinate dehydrogenase flavin-adding protein (antitoxin of CptAB toxin-antitoxin module)